MIFLRVDDLHDFRDIFDISTQSAFTCSKLTIETVEEGVKNIQS